MIQLKISLVKRLEIWYEMFLVQGANVCDVETDQDILLQVRVTNVMDKAFGKMTVTGTSAEDTEGTTVLSNKVFTAGPDK